MKREAKRHVQRVAIGLFESRGFDAVSVAEVAAAADVAERSVYRYFGTKEGIVVSNESDDDFLHDAAGQLSALGLNGALRAAIATMDDHVSAEQLSLSRRQVALIDATPRLRAHMAAATYEAGTALGRELAIARGRPATDLESLLDASVAISALHLATFDWERTGHHGSLPQALTRALDHLETWSER